MSHRSRIFRTSLFALAALPGTLALAPAVHAQLALPGAVEPAPEGSLASPAKPKPRKLTEEEAAARGAAIAPKPPSEDALIGKPLQLDGTRSAIEFQRNGADLQVKRLTLAGDRIKRSGESCRIEVEGMPMRLTQIPNDNGLRRYLVDFPACPFSFDALDGAILVANGKACELKSADCRTDPAGLWGMGDTEFDPKTSKDMLGQRARVEKTVRADFRALYDKNKKDLPLRKYLVREQAGFSSWREEVCRSYAHESDYGYCALRLTEARALALGTQLAKGVKLPPDAEKALAEETAAKKTKKR